MSKHLSSSRRARGLVASFAAVALGVTGLVALATSASATPGHGQPKYFVCKYVGTPGDNERLQTGQNPISVAASAIAMNPVAVNSYFNDQHGRSYVLAEDVGQPKPSASTCPAGTVEVTPAAPDYTPPSCEAAGTFEGVATSQYTWSRSGPDTAPVLTAVAVGNVKLVGQTVFNGGDLTQLTGEECLGEQPRRVTPEVQVTPPTCEAAGSALGAESEYYTWGTEILGNETWLFANPVGNVELAKSEFGPYLLAKLTGEQCLSDTPLIPETPVVPPVVKQATLAETGFPLLGVLGLAGSFSLIGGGLVNARRLLRKSA